MGHDHDHLPSEIRHEKPLWWALGLTTTFLLVEVIGAFWTNSLALLSDAAHMATDTLALMIALVAVRLSRRPPDAKRTYGYARLEALGAMINGGMLFVVAGYILWEAVQRFRAPQEIASTGMLVIAVFGLVINLISMRLLRAGSGLLDADREPREALVDRLDSGAHGVHLTRQSRQAFASST